MCFIKLEFGLLCVEESVEVGGLRQWGNVGVVVTPKRSPEETNQNFSTLPSCLESHWGLRCALHGLILPKLDCLSESNQSFVNYHFGNESPITGKQNCNARNGTPQTRNQTRGLDLAPTSEWLWGFILSYWLNEMNKTFYISHKKTN